MKPCLGIDTGGTYTDAVIYDAEGRRVLSSAKALTTKEDLSVGITNALSALDRELLKNAVFASLSTTLATNACVEGKGGRAKLLFIGMDRETFSRVGADFGMRSDDEVYTCGGSGSFNGKIPPSPDWDAIMNGTREWIGDAEGLGIVEMFAVNNGAQAEREAKCLFSSAYPDLPIVCSSELFNGINSVQRGAGTLLNARLVTVIRDFLFAIGRSFTRFGISCPVMIVRSDGSLMSRASSISRPVETILCGPAASVLGATALSGERSSVIVDMGGTTTDISLVRGGRTVRAENGISIGGWRTFVKGVFTDTFALGGDSAIRCHGEQWELCPDRVVPVSLLASRYPGVTDALERLVASERVHTRPLHEFFTLVRDVSGKPGITELEADFCRALKESPLIFEKAAAAVGRDIYTLDVKRLEAEGAVLRCGVTPTDIMHLKGDFTPYDTAAPRLAVRFMLRCMGRPDTDGEVSRFCDEVYDRVKKTLYRNIVRILIQNKYPALSRSGLGRELEAVISSRWDELKNGERGMFDCGFVSNAPLVGIGAPIHIFLPDVAKALGTQCIIPDSASVANAVGAVVGSISATAEVEVRPNHSADGVNGYFVCSSRSKLYFKERAQAVEQARIEADELARQQARERGVKGELSVELEQHRTEGTSSAGYSIELSTKIIATAVGGSIL